MVREERENGEAGSGEEVWLGRRGRMVMQEVGRRCG